MLGLMKTAARGAAVILAAALVACAGGPTYNPTVFPYEIEEERLAADPLKTVIIPHINLGSPSRNYLEPVEPRLDGLLTRYLKDNGYEVLPQRLFRQHWNTAVRAFEVIPVQSLRCDNGPSGIRQGLQAPHEELRQLAVSLNYYSVVQNE